MVQLQRLAPRWSTAYPVPALWDASLSHPLKKAKNAFLQGTSYDFVPGQSPPHFGQSVQKVKRQPLGLLVLCLSGLGENELLFSLTKALPLFFVLIKPPLT